MKNEREGKPQTLFLNYEFDRVTFISKNNARHQGFIKGNSFIRNTKIHSIQNK